MILTEYILPVVIIFVLIILNGIFVAAEFALVTAPRTKLRSMEEKGSTIAARILKIVSDPETQNQYITTAQVGITVASLGLGMYGEHVIADWLLEPLRQFEQIGEALAHTVATLASVSLLTYLHVVIGEMIPKSFALQASSQVAITLYYPLNLTNKIFSPLIRVLNVFSNAVINLIGLSPGEDESRLYTSGDIEFAVEESLDSGMLEATDHLFIDNILDLDERTVGQVLTPRNRVYAIADDLSPEAIIETICTTTKTRYPVYHQTMDKVLGILHIKDLARYYTENQQLPENIEALLRPVLYIPESLPLNTLLSQFKQNHTHIAVVLDEFGGTLGVITLEDLIEEVVGEILDEFDQEPPPIQKVSDNLYKVRGDVILEELEQHLGIKFDDEADATTIAGFVMAKIGSIPKHHDTLNLPEMIITVETVQKRSVQFVTILTKSRWEE